jgi:hypothetical protein
MIPDIHLGENAWPKDISYDQAILWLSPELKRETACQGWAAKSACKYFSMQASVIIALKLMVSLA